MKLKDIPNILEVQTTTIKAYMKSRGFLCLERAFTELYEIRYEMDAMPSEKIRCKNEAEAYQEGGPIPYYAVKALETIRKYQVEVRTRC